MTLFSNVSYEEKVFELKIGKKNGIVASVQYMEYPRMVCVKNW